MKTKLFFLLVGVSVLSTYNTYADEAMFEPDTEWHYLETNMQNGEKSQRTFSIQENHVNGVVYQNIQGVLLRSEGAKIWCLIDSADQQVEQLLYNFDLQVGDSIRTIDAGTYNPEAPHLYAKVTHVENITLSDGRAARQISYDNRSDDIEHIGNVKGILGAANNTILPRGIFQEFVCCSRNEYLLYETEKGACDNLDTFPDSQDTEQIVESSKKQVSKCIKEGRMFITHEKKIYTTTGQTVK